jgi:pantothenate synthetase
MRVKQMADAGERDAGKLIAAGREEVATEESVRLDYFEIVDPENLNPVEDAGKGGLVAVAAFLGSTRLIDNVVLG